MAKTKADQALAAAQRLAKTADDWVDLHNQLFGIGGEITRLFPTEQGRTAFTKSGQADQVYALFDELRDKKGDPPKGEFSQKLSRANGAMSIRLPRAVHAALLLEAEAEGVSLNQLCLSKLAVQLRALV